jgi:transcriptional regulator with XRE-family HTH domain
VNGEAQRRHDLADFLRARRRQVVRADVGLPPAGRKTTGLRREEVAYLSGVSITWYTWLEQGRKIRPSRHVLDAVARTLRLTVAEHSYLLSLAGYAATQLAAEPDTPTAPARVQRFLDSLVGLPALACALDWDILGWNRTYAAVYPNVATVPPLDRNLLWLVLTDPYLRELIPDWEVTSRRYIAEFRATAGPRLGEPSVRQLVRRLGEASEPFRASWESHDIEGFISRERLLHHPIAGDLHLEQYRMAPSDLPDLQLVIFTPVPATDTAAKLSRLVGGTAAR